MNDYFLKDYIFIEFINSLSEKYKISFNNHIKGKVFRNRYLYNLPLLGELIRFINYLSACYNPNRFAKLYFYKNIILFDRRDKFVLKKIKNLSVLNYSYLNSALEKTKQYFEFKKGFKGVLKNKKLNNKNINKFLLFFFYLDYKVNYMIARNLIFKYQNKFSLFACPPEFTSSFLGMISGFKSANLEFILMSLKRNNFNNMSYPSFHVDYHISKFESYLNNLQNKYLEKNILIKSKTQKLHCKQNLLENKNINLGFFLSSYYEFNLKELEKFIENILLKQIYKILSFYQPGKYTIFTHPNDKKINKFIKKKKLNTFCGNKRTEEINKINLAIIGNTSMGDYLLERDIMVLYSNNLDNYDSDYFGYIEDDSILDITKKLITLNEVNDYYQKKLNYKNLNKNFKVFDNLNDALDLY